MSETPKSESEMAETETDTRAEEGVEASAEAEAETLEPVASLAADADAPAEESYSLSGIGAGFGLGALTAKTEASGIPGPSAFAEAAPEKVVIDATDDVLPEIEGESRLPALEPVTAGAGVSFSPAADDGETMTKPSPATTQDASTDILKPKTRFNPWD